MVALSPQQRKVVVDSKFRAALEFIDICKLDVVNPQNTGGNCIAHSLAVRDFLHKLGIAAEVRSVVVSMIATQAGVQLHSLACGMKVAAEIEPAGGWDGHLVVVSHGVLIDPTFYQFRRPAWSWTDDVAMLRLIPKDQREMSNFYGHKKPVLASLVKDEGDYHFDACWIANPANAGWQKLKAARPDRRNWLVAEMLRKFETIRDL